MVGGGDAHSLIPPCGWDGFEFFLNRAREGAYTVDVDWQALLSIISVSQPTFGSNVSEKIDFIPPPSPLRIIPLTRLEFLGIKRRVEIVYVVFLSPVQP